MGVYEWLGHRVILYLIYAFYRHFDDWQKIMVTTVHIYLHII